MSTATTASRAHSDLAERLRNPVFIKLMTRTLHQFLSASIEALKVTDDTSELHDQRATELLYQINLAILRGVQDCRTYLLDVTLAQSLSALIDSFDPHEQRHAPPEPTGIVWFGTPLLLPHAMGATQRVDAMTWTTLNVQGIDEEGYYSDDHRRFVCIWWAHTGDGRGEDELTEWIKANAERKTGQAFDYADSFGPWRLGGATHLREHGEVGPARIEVGDEDLDALAEAGLELVNTDSPGTGAILSAIWGLLTGKLAALDGAGERDIVIRDVEPNASATKRARRAKRAPQVHTVSLGARREGSGTPEPLRGTGTPLGVQAYTPGYWRRPRGSAPDAKRTVWVEGFWRGDTDLPVSENSTVYVARAPRGGKR